MSRAPAAWAEEVRCRRARLAANTFPWLAPLLEQLLRAAEHQLARARAR